MHSFNDEIKKEDVELRHVSATEFYEVGGVYVCNKALEKALPDYKIIYHVAKGSDEVFIEILHSKNMPSLTEDERAMGKLRLK